VAARVASAGRIGQVPPRPASVRQEDAMRGVITRKEVLANSLLIIRLWGPRCYVRCLRAALSSAPSTFLEVVTA
jgi:hypothetical protein